MVSEHSGTLSGMEPRPVALDEQLPKPIYACKLLCRVCREWVVFNN